MAEVINEVLPQNNPHVFSEFDENDQFEQKRQASARRYHYNKRSDKVKTESLGA
jgi:hypothetical protein